MLHELAHEHALHLSRKATAQEKEAPSLAQLLHGLWDRGLNVDLCQNFDKVGVRHKEVACRPHRAEWLIEQCLPAVMARRLDAGMGAVGIEVVDPVAIVFSL